MKIVEMLLNYLDFLKILIFVSFLLISFYSSVLLYEPILHNEKSIYIPFFIKNLDIEKKKDSNKSNINKNKVRIEIKGFYLNEIKQNSSIFSLSEQTENISQLSEKINLKNNLNDKNDELSKMFIESMSSLNSWKTNEIENELFQEINWNIEKRENQESLVSQYVFPKCNINDNISSSSISLSPSFLNSNSEIKENEEKELSSYKLGICRTFGKLEENKIKSNIVKEINEKIFKVYSDGNPYLIKEKCRKETIPNNFYEIYEKNKQIGYDILGFSGKKLKMNYLQSQKVERIKCETNMTFLGIVIYKIINEQNDSMLLIKGV